MLPHPAVPNILACFRPVCEVIHADEHLFSCAIGSASDLKTHSQSHWRIRWHTDLARRTTARRFRAIPKERPTVPVVIVTLPAAWKAKSKWTLPIGRR